MNTNTLQTNVPEGRTTRLFGANIFFDLPGAVHDIPVKEDQDRFIELWLTEVNRVALALNWCSDYKIAHKKYSNGIRFAISSTIDLLWPATFLLETIWLSVSKKYEGGDFLTLDDTKSKMLPLIEEYTNLMFRQVHAEAIKRGLNVFEERGNVIIGSGVRSFKSELASLSFKDIPWDNIGEVPSVIVTGTNGKTTTVRLTRYINQFAGKVVGYCSSDWVMVGDEIIEEGDLSGPSGNQSVMMHPKVEVAVLEAARGGLLRRGILTNFAVAAAVTNISEDHLGIDGVDTLEELAAGKSLVYKAVAKDGYAVINLDDEQMRAIIPKISHKKIFVTKNINNLDNQKYLHLASHICYIENNAFYFLSNGSDAKFIADFKDVPITVNGHALHNIENTMTAIALSFAIGCELSVISNAIKSYENTAKNNQGRANVFDYNGGKIIIDFAHNVAGISAILRMARSYVVNGGRLGILFGNTGDRKGLAPGIADSMIAAKVDCVVIKELSHHLRGTKPGELVEQMKGLLIERGLNKDQIKTVADEFDALDVVLDYIKPGDAFVFCAHISTSEIIKKLNALEQKL